MNLHIHDIQLSGKDQFANDFNYVGKLWAKANDESLPEHDRERFQKEYFDQKLNLEQGYPLSYLAELD